MKHYTVLYAEEVPHYGTLDIEALNDAAAIEAAKSRELSGIAIDPDYENSVCRRIVRVEDDAGNIIADEISLDGCFLRYGGEPERTLCIVAPDLLIALRVIAEIPLYGEPLPETMADLKADLIEAHEYDPEDQTYTPCVDTESSHLEHAVETARAALAKLKGGVA